MAIKILALCKSGRLHALVQALLNSAWHPDVYAASDVNNPCLVPSDHFFWGKTDDSIFIEKCIREIKPDIAIIGPEEPLEKDIADLFWRHGVPCVGPLGQLAKLETSKAFTRNLMTEFEIPGCPEHRVFRGMDSIEEYLRELKEFVIKPDGLSGGKGVKVFGDHLHSISEALSYCAQLFRDGQKAILVEEKLDGEEFSFQSFYDGYHIAHMVPVQDHKRAWEGDKGPNTGGMGSYSCEDHLLPFLNPEHIAEAGKINRLIGEALFKKTGLRYKGILYGGFILTKKGLKVIEYNARFGDPEIMNVLPILKTDFVDVCRAIVDGTLDKIDVQFEHRATVCKYIVPRSYPGKLKNEAIIDVSELESLRKTEPNIRVFYGAVEAHPKGLRLTGSRAIGIVGIADSLKEAERVAERASCCVKGDVYHRKDIGTAALIEKRMAHMDRIFSRESGQSRKASPLRAVG